LHCISRQLPVLQALQVLQVLQALWARVPSV